MKVPIPEFQMRQLVGPTEESAFEIKDSENIYSDLSKDDYSQVFDLGCGCGRLARKLILQRDNPKKYIGIDIHSGMIKWCQENLTTFNGNFQFKKFNAFNVGLNPEGLTHPTPLPFPVEDNWATLVIAHSLFTHLTENQIRDYLSECARVLSAEGLIRSTWFLFDKENYPMMQESQNCLYINEIDPTNAVIVAKSWFLKMVLELDLYVSKVEAPTIKGFQWEITLRHRMSNESNAKIPPDSEIKGINRPPEMPLHADKIGL
jgi:SAM-dependent methyltransferase